MKKIDFNQRVGFLVSEVGRLYGRQFDQMSRERLGLSRAQCRLLGQVAYHATGPQTQAELAQELDLTPMAVATMCDRMEKAGWITRRSNATDRRAKAITLQPPAEQAMDAAIGVSDTLQDIALSGFAPEERAQLVALLQRVRNNLQQAAGSGVAAFAEEAQA